MKKNVRLFAGGIIISAIVFACQKDDMLTPQEVQAPQVVTNGVVAEKGRLSFATVEDFKKTILSLKVMTETEREVWDKNISFTSMQEFYNQNKEGIILNSENPVFKTRTTEKPYIPDVLFAHILNEQGVVVINDLAYKFTSDGNRAEVKMIDENLLNSTILDSKVKKVKIVVQFQDKTAKDIKKGARTEFDYPVGSADFGNNYAAHAYFSTSGFFPFYSSFATKIKMEHYGGWWIFASWSAETAQNLSVNNSFFYLDNWAAGTFYGSGSGSCNDCSEQYVFLREIWGPLVFSTIYFNASYSATWGGQTTNFSF